MAQTKEIGMIQHWFSQPETPTQSEKPSDIGYQNSERKEKKRKKRIGEITAIQKLDF
jgi:hypothetical protein